MTISINNVPDIHDVVVTGDELRVVLSNGRSVRAPLEAFPRLREALPEQRADWRLIGGGVGIHWPQLDEDLSAIGLTSGKFRYDITADDLRQYDWQDVIEQQKIKQCYSYHSPLYLRAQELEKADDYIGASVFRLLGAIASFHPNFDIRGNPFGPMWRDQKRRSVMAEDLGKEDLEALSAIYKDIKDPEFRARVADVLWETTRNHEAARVAVSSYLESALRLEDNMWPPFVDRLERALRLGLNLNDKSLRSSVLDHIESAIARHHTDLESGLLSARLMESLLPFRQEKASAYSKLSEQLARQFASTKQWDFAKEYWRIASQWFRQLNQLDEVQRTEIEAAETMAAKAEDNLKNKTPSYGFAAHWMGKAVEALRQAKASPDRIDAAHRRFLELERRITTELKTIQVNYDEIPGLTEQIEKQIEAARNHVRGQPFSKALRRLAFIVRPVDTNRLRERLLNQMKDFPLRSLFGSEALSITGKVTDSSPPLISNLEEEHEQALTKNMFLQAREIDWPHNVRFAIEPARQQITDEHAIRLADLAFLVSYNPFIPVGHEGIYARGIQAGFFGDWLVATHLLIPQIEASIRYIFEQLGIPTSTLDSDGSQKERDLGWLVNHEKLAEMFGKGTAFDLRGILTEKFGHNLRNDFAHGLLPESGFYGEASEYLWWLAIRLSFVGIGAIQQPTSQQS